MSVIAEREYQPFANVPARNVLQQIIEVPLFAAALRLPKGGRVLEVGCGRGIALAPLARVLRPHELVGLDCDFDLLVHAAEIARDIAADIELFHADVRSMPFPNAAFDVVIDFGTCYHIAHNADALREIARVLRPGGVFATETELAQGVAHPIRTTRRGLPWSEVPELVRGTEAGLWRSAIRR